MSMYSYRFGPKLCNSTLNFDPDTLRGRITPSLASAEMAAINQFANGGEAVYSGSNCKVILEMRQLAASGSPRFSKQLLELTTMSVSVHRAKAQARAAGYVNPKGIARGGRTIAGTMVMTKFAAEVLLRFLASGLTSDKTRSLRPMKPKAPRARARAGRRHSTWVARLHRRGWHRLASDSRPAQSLMFLSRSAARSYRP